MDGERADAPGGAVDEHDLSGLRVDGRDGGDRGGPGQGYRGGSDEVQPGRFGGDPGRWDQRVFGQGAGLDRRGHQNVSDHLVADRHMVDPGADGLDDTGGVPTEDHRVFVREHLGQHPGGYGVVEGVQSGGLDPDQHGALGDLGDGQVGQLRLLAGGRDVQCAHDGLTLVSIT